VIYILDSSFCGAFIMPDEKSPAVNKFFTCLSEDSIIHVPGLFWFEISNLLTQALKRKRIGPADIAALPDMLPQSKFHTDISCGPGYVKSITGLAVKYRLSSYDASYLELALRKRAFLGTLDDGLFGACSKAGLEIIPV
jgi:predicted nucleic acid-binding protein